MQESHREGVAIHPDPESCVVTREGAIEALTGAQAGRVLSCEIIATRSADAVQQSGRPHASWRYCEPTRDSAQSETPCMSGYSARENRETPSTSAVVGRPWVGQRRPCAAHLTRTSVGSRTVA